jgi:peptidoglycan/xylan/chitin deacetylase (PgdA/CDA1 family)
MQILYAHRVSKVTNISDPGPDRANTIRPEALTAFLEQRQNFRALGCVDLLNFQFPKSAERPGYVLTFDDGYLDNLTTALPILEQFAIPVVIFITTGFVDGSIMQPEKVIAECVRKCSILRAPDGREFDCSDHERKWRVYNLLRAKIKTMNFRQRSAFLGALTHVNSIDVPPDGDLFLTGDQVRVLDRHPLVTIGAHTRSHVLLTTVSSEEAYLEILHCKMQLEGIIEHEVNCFAYPYGGHNSTVRSQVALAGFQMAFTTEGVALQDLTDRYDISRINIKTIMSTDEY